MQPGRFPNTIACFVLVLTLLSSGLVRAHAELQASIPEDGAVFSSFDGVMVLTFSEPVAPISVQLLNGEGMQIALTDVHSIDNKLDFETLEPPPKGQYLLSYRVLSLDSHPVGGSVGFAIGNLPPPVPQYSAADPTVLYLARINRGIYLSAILACLGLVMYPFLFTLPADTESRRQKWVSISAITGMLTAITGLGLWGVLLNESSPATLLQPGPWSIAMQSSQGTSFSMVMIGLVGVLTAGLLGSGFVPGRLAALLGVLLVAAGFGATGHAAAAGLPMSPVFVLHALAAGIWFGSLLLLYRFTRTEDAPALVAILKRFSTRASILVAVLLSCAVIICIYQLEAVEQLWLSDYGQWLLIKLGLVLAVLALAAVNRWRLTPELQSNESAAMRPLRLSILAEGLIILAVIAVTTVLASTAPPPADPDQTTKIVSLTAREGTDLELRMTPATAGRNRIELVFNNAGTSLEPLEVEVSWEQEAAGIQPIEGIAVRTGNGTYVVEDIDLFVDGPWRIRVEALIDDFTRERFETEIAIEN